MITFELAKDLKRSHFPQGSRTSPVDWYWSTRDYAGLRDEPEVVPAAECDFDSMDDLYAAPLLSELLAACPDQTQLIKQGAKIWLATCPSSNGSTDERFRGECPEDVIGLLWVALAETPCAIRMAEDTSDNVQKPTGHLDGNALLCALVAIAVASWLAFVACWRVTSGLK